MNTYFDSLKRGEQPTDSEWQDLLKSWHNTDPGMTPGLLTCFPTDSGVSSYEHMLQIVPNLGSSVVVDLACGDGVLESYLLDRIAADGRIIGVDMSAGELAVAQKRLHDSRVSFVKAYAHDTGLESSSVDHVFCHLALMLMLPIQPVLDEIARILKPGAMLTAVVQSMDELNPESAQIFGWMREWVVARLPGSDVLRLGNTHFHAGEYIDELFAQQSELTLEHNTAFSIMLSGTPAQLWGKLAGYYPPRLLSSDVRQQMDVEALDLLSAMADDRGVVTIPFPCRRLQALRK